MECKKCKEASDIVSLNELIRLIASGDYPTVTGDQFKDLTLKLKKDVDKHDLDEHYRNGGY